MKLDCLRGFPHVLARVKALWGEPELELYVRSLMIPDRPRHEGFPPKAFKELDMIVDVHRLLFGKCDRSGEVDLCCVKNLAAPLKS